MRPKSLLFTDRASRPKHGFVMICDLEGFSRFFSQPDVHDYVAIFLNRVLSALDICISGGEQYWLEPPENAGPLDLQPTHVKFMGDGALFIWTPRATEHGFSSDFVQVLCNRLWNLKSFFDVVVSRSADEVPVMDLPRRIRFGLARGSVYELQSKTSKNKEYIGFCINLAARLQSYCPQLGFVASARIGLPASLLKENDYIRVVAKKIRGFPNEIVVVDRAEYEGLDARITEELFQALP